MPWFKLDCGWWLSEWIVPLSEGAQLSWTRLIEYTKEKGSRGTVKAISPLVASRIWMVSQDSAAEMISAAISEGALTVDDGDWTLVNWDQYQSDPTAAERQAKSRANKSQKSQEVTAGNDVSQNVTVTNGDIRESRLEERRGEERKVDNNPLPPSEETVTASDHANGRQRKKFVKPTAQEVADYSKEISLPLSEGRGFFDYQESKGWKVGNAPMVDWKASVRTWKGNLEKRAKPSSNGVHHPPAAITIEQAQSMLTGEGLEDRGSPIQRRKPAEGQN